MLRETGRVVAVDAQGVWVETIRKSTCGSCAARRGCGHGLLERYAGDRRGLVRALPGPALSPGECRVGDQVLLELPEAVLLRGSLVVYALPLCVMIAGAVLPGLAGAPGDAGALLGAGAGLGLGLALVRWHSRRHREDRRLHPTLAERVAAPAHRLTAG